MAELTASPCRSCGAPLIWGVTENHKRMPVDAKPEKRVVFERRGNGLPPLARVVDTYVSHFATCPAAAEHRKKQPSAPAAEPKPSRDRKNHRNHGQ